MKSEANTDRVFTSILQCRLKAITEEMGYTLLRTSRSPILNEARDFVTGLYDARGRMMEQAEYIPVLDMIAVRRYLDKTNTRLLGPNCPGLITPEQAKLIIIRSIV